MGYAFFSGVSHVSFCFSFTFSAPAPFLVEVHTFFAHKRFSHFLLVPQWTSDTINYSKAKTCVPLIQYLVKMTKTRRKHVLLRLRLFVLTYFLHFPVFLVDGLSNHNAFSTSTALCAL